MRTTVKQGKMVKGVYHAIGGEKWRAVHDGKACKGRTCIIHNPSKHNMRNWRMHLRETGLVERICDHGIGHPDPDSAEFFNQFGPEGSRGTWGIHGCDGCCVEPYRTLD